MCVIIINRINFVANVKREREMVYGRVWREEWKGRNYVSILLSQKKKKREARSFANLPVCRWDRVSRSRVPSFSKKRTESSLLRQHLCNLSKVWR